MDNVHLDTILSIKSYLKLPKHLTINSWLEFGLELVSLYGQGETGGRGCVAAAPPLGQTMFNFSA